MRDRSSAPSKLLPLLAETGEFRLAVHGVWATTAQPLAETLELSSTRLLALRDECLETLAAWSAQRAEEKPGRYPLTQWLVKLRQDLSLEELLLTLVRLERALRQASWQLGLPAPDWLALSEHLSAFFEALFAEASSGWRGLVAQNHQLREELAYFRQLAASLDAGADRGAHLTLAVRETARLLKCEFCAILLPEEEARDVLAIRAAVAPKILSNALDGMSFPLAENGLIAQVFLTGAPASTYQPLEDLEITMRRRQTLESLGFSQLMAYPLQWQGRVLGVLCVANRLDKQPWQSLEEEWLGTVAGQLAASLRLFQLGERAPETEFEAALALEGALQPAAPGVAARGARAGRLAVDLGQALGLDGARLAALEWAGRLHGVGLLGVPEPGREPGGAWNPLTAQALREHPAAGATLLASLASLSACAPAVRHQAERWDGAGHPDGLSEQAIPLEARILAVAIAQAEAGEAGSPGANADALGREAGTRFDPLVVQALKEVLRGGFARLEAPSAGPVLEARVEAAQTASRLPEGPETSGRWMSLLAELVGASGPDLPLERFWTALSGATEAAAGALYLLGETSRLSLDRAWRCEAPPAAAPVPESTLEAYVAACRVPVGSTNRTHDARFSASVPLGEPDREAALAVPVVFDDRLLGVLALYGPDGTAWSERQVQTLELAAGVLAVALAGKRLRERERAERDVDALTGAGSARVLLGRLQEELKRAARHDLPLSVLLVDLDGFEAFNEQEGYGLGDEALAQTAGLLRDRARPADLVARFEHDAFALLLPECGAQDAMRLAEEVRLAIGASLYPARRAGGARLTASVGVTTVPAGQRPTPGAVLADLRQALAKARDEGANRLVFHASVPTA